MSVPIRRLFGAALLVALGGGALDAAAQSAKPSGSTKSRARVQQTRDTSTTIEVYGFAQADAIYDFNQNNAEWFDVLRPSKLPAVKNEFGANGRTWFSVRQSRFGVKADIPTKGKNNIKAVFEWDLFGVGVDAGQTTIRPRHIYGQWGQFGAGQTNSVFMDIDVFPNSLDYWGPNGMLFYRNVQLWWQPINKPNGTRATIALERPGASGDGGVFSDRVELQNVRGRFPAPDISAEYHYAGDFGYVELAGIVRWIRWDDLLADAFDLAGGTTGWGVVLSSNLNAGKSNVFRLLAIYGAGVENYFNDAPVDVGVETKFGNPRQPIDGEALGDFGMSAFLDHRWNSELTTAVGYSRVDIDNSNAQAGTAYKAGQYALLNLLWTPAANVMAGGELQWAHRQNLNGFSSDDYRLQFSFKYIFSQKFRR